MTRERRIRAAGAMVFAILGAWLVLVALWPLLAQAQDGPTGTAVPDPLTSALVGLIRDGGLPAVLALAAWWARGVVTAGLSITVQLSPEDRRLLVAAIEARDSIHRFEERITDHDRVLERLERELDGRDARPR